MFRRPPEAKRSDTLFPCPPLVRSSHPGAQEAVGRRGPRGLVGAAVVDAWMPGAADEGFHRARLLPGKKRPRAARPRPWGFEESGGHLLAEQGRALHRIGAAAEKGLHQRRDRQEQRDRKSTRLNSSN